MPSAGPGSFGALSVSCSGVTQPSHDRADVIVYGWYFVQVLLEASTTPVEDVAYQAGLLVVVVVLVVLSVIGISVLAALARREAQEDEDERDRLIEMRGDQRT